VFVVAVEVADIIQLELDKRSIHFDWEFEN
jgi:hypothetical protein